MFENISFHDRALLEEALREKGWRVIAENESQVVAERGASRITFTRRSTGAYVPRTEESQKTELYELRKEFNLRVVTKVTKALKASSSAPVATKKAIRIRVRA